jgi:hypothetical protein
MIIGMIWQWIGMDLATLIGLREVLRLIRMILDIEKGMATVSRLDGYLSGPLWLSQFPISPCRSAFSTHPAVLKIKLASSCGFLNTSPINVSQQK